MPITEPTPDPVGLLVEEFLDRFRRGERPAVSEYEARLPEHADRIRQLFPVLVVMEQAGDRSPSATGDLNGTALAPEGTVPDRIGGYRVVREIGRGGMGVVYEAEQLALGRRVALKVLPAEVVGRGVALERFRREARSAARLHHTNIVPVYEVGEDDGRCYYAMQLIRGQPLDEVIDELRRLGHAPGEEKAIGPSVARSLLDGFAPTVTHAGDTSGEALTNTSDDRIRSGDSGALPGVGDRSTALTDRRAYFRSVARIGAQTADALDYAHREGVVHRDVKPGNLLLDTDGRVWVADFGLAKSEADGLTQNGDIVGTVRYMAPERFSGWADPRSDVYVLGLTLYELLVLRPAFAEPDRLALIKQISHAAPPAPRRLDPTVPRDLETVVLRAIEKEPSQRYQTAAELADDLRRFTEGHPVLARRLGRVEQAWRWARRNPVVTGLLGAVFALLTTVTVVATVSAVRIDDKAHEATVAAENERKAKKDADRQRDEGEEKLLQSYISEARASRYSRRIGQRFGTLDAVRKAAALARKRGKPPETFDELRNLAIAALVLPDMRADSAWVDRPADQNEMWGEPVPDPTFRRAAVAHRSGTVSIRKIGTGPNDGGEVARLPGLGSRVETEWSRDGRHLAVRHTAPNRLQMWRADVAPPALVLDLLAVAGAWISPDARYLVVRKAAPNRLQVWRTGEAGPNLVLDLIGGEDAIFTPDGHRVLVVQHAPGGTGVVAREYNLDLSRKGSEIPLPPGTGRTIDTHPLRAEVAIGTKNEVIVVDLDTGKELTRLPTPGQTGTVRWHPAGELLSVSFAHHIEIWDVSRARRLWRLEHKGGGANAGFNRVGDLLVSMSWDQRGRVWDPLTGRELLSVFGLTNRFGADDRVASRFPNAPQGPAFPLTALEAGREYRALAIAPGTSGVINVTSCSLHPGGRLLAVAHDRIGVSLLDLASGTKRSFIRAPLCYDVSFESDGSLLVGTDDAMTRWPVAVAPGEPPTFRVGPPELLPVFVEPVFGASADGGVLAARSSGGASVWRRDRPWDAVRVRHDECRHVAISPDGAHLATGSWEFGSGGIKVWETTTGRLVRTLIPDSVMTIPVFSPDGQWLMNRDGKRWRVANGSEGPKPPPNVSRTRFSPDGLVVHDLKGTVLLANAATGRELARLEDPNQDLYHHITFSPDGALLIGVTTDSSTARVWDLRKIRAGLVELGLDWEAPPYPPGSSPDPGARPFQVRIDGEELIASPARLKQAERERVLLALWVNPFDADARLALGNSLLTANRPREAEVQFTAALAVRPDQIGGYRLRAAARFRSGNWAGCVADAEAVLARRPDEWVRAQRALSLVRLGRHADALPDLTTTIQNFPGDAGVYMARAAAYRALGKTDEAAADLKQAAKLAESLNRPEILNDTAWRLLTGPEGARDPKRALELAKKANERKPNTSAILNTLGVALYQNGQYQEAATALEKGLTLGGGVHDAHTLFPLAMCRARLGDRAAAKRCFDQAVKWIEGRSLTPEWTQELADLRAEAEQVLDGK
jgi:serine/threonine protein kinase/WD40 repeat protein/tetratricopeptide (TPR) repeat protein